MEKRINHLPKERPITCRLNQHSAKIELQVLDEGPGIPYTEKKNVVKRFYRLGDETTRKTQGTGLGLYLCKKIAKDHNADIVVTNNIPHGSNFTVTFYI